MSRELGAPARPGVSMRAMRSRALRAPRRVVRRSAGERRAASARSPLARRREPRVGRRKARVRERGPAAARRERLGAARVAPRAAAHRRQRGRAAASQALQQSRRGAARQSAPRRLRARALRSGLQRCQRRAIDPLRRRISSTRACRAGRRSMRGCDDRLRRPARAARAQRQQVAGEVAAVDRRDVERRQRLAATACRTSCRSGRGSARAAPCVSSVRVGALEQLAGA